MMIQIQPRTHIMEISREYMNEDQQFLFLIQDSFLSQHMLEPTRGEYVLYIVLSSQNELLDNVKIHEPLRNSYHNQIYVDIKVKSSM